MSEQNHANPQSKQNRIYEIIHQINKKSEDGDYIFRGEPECYEKVSSTLYRQLEKARVESPGDMVENVQSSELEEASKFTKKTDEFEILSELQHFGGKTNLIDFTTGPYIALFFACYGPDSLEKDGRVILQDKNGAAKDWIREPRNSDSDSRVGAQKSIFVRPPKGVVVPDKEIIIPKDLKQPILTFLARQEPPISPESVYHDLHGFISSQEIRWKTYAIFGSGGDWQRKGDEAENPDEKRECYQKADDCFTEVIKRQPDNFGAYHNRGNARVQKGEVDKAIDDYTEALRLNRVPTVAYNGRGLAYIAKGEIDTAIADFTTAIELDPDFAIAYSNRGGAHREKGAFDDAIADFTTAIKLDPNRAETYSNRGAAYRDNGEVDTAIADFTKAIELDPAFTVAYYGRGSAYDDKYNIEKAIADYNKAIELNPDYAEAYSDLGVAYWKKGEVDTAIANYTKAIELNPNYAAAYNNRGAAYMQNGEVDTAINDFEKAIALNPNYAQAYRNLGRVYLISEEFEKAIANFDKALELNPSNALANQYRELAFQRLQEQTQR